ncbi:MAG: ion channel [Sneathiella sp.]
MKIFNKTSDKLSEENTLDKPKFGFSILLVLLLSFVVIPSYITDTDAHTGVWLNLIFSSILLSSLYLVAHERREFLIGCLIAAATLLFSWTDYVRTDTLGSHLAIGLYIVFFCYIIFMLARYLFETNEVSANMIYASVCLYLLMGLMWTFIYFWIEKIHPGSFSNTPVITDPDQSFLLVHFSYFSFVTISTLGYGDIVPITRIARSWTNLEAIAGQFYLAIVVARLVGLHISAKRK